MVISTKFFNSKNTPRIAQSLLGKFLVRRYRGKTHAYMITDVEAYDGWKDGASHAHRGKTERNAPMFAEAGHWYAYFTYGMHWLLNIVTGPKNYPAAILIRGVQGISGPARITKMLHIDKKLNGLPANKKTGLWIAAQKGRASPKAGRLHIKNGPRIGVDYAGPIWSKKLYRFYL